jgi:uracil-DNA glycosylase
MSIRAYQKRCFQEYKASLGLPDNYCYLYGNPVNVLVPVETAMRGVMIVGAYPSAKFFTVQGISDVPLYDNDAPFSSEFYFDGNRVRSIPSGQELNQRYLAPLGIQREQCWITDLVKIFLFKPGHVERYQKLGVTDIEENRSRYKIFAQRSLQWLEEEIKLAEPQVAFLLGVEVTSTLFQISDAKAKSLLDGRLLDLHIGEAKCQSICLPHPGILMKPGPRNPWPARFEAEILPRVREELTRLDFYRAKAAI